MHKLVSTARQMHAGQTLGASQAQFSAVVNSALDAMITADSDQRIILLNSAAERMFGYTAQEIVGFQLDHLLPERFRQTPFDISVFATGRHVNGFPAPMAVRANGQEFPIESSISVVSISGERYFTAIVRDVTLRECASAELRKSEERFAKAFHCSPLALTISTVAEERYLDANEAFFQMVGCERQDVIGRTMSEIAFWEAPEHCVELLRLLKEGGRVVALRTQFKTSTGEIRRADISAEMIDIEGQPCVLIVTRDITDAQQMEAQFVQAQKMEAVGRLAGGIAHDFNNILGVIIGYSDLALNLVDPANPANAHLEKIKIASKRAVLLTRQLLAFSRHQAVYPRILDLNELVSHVIDMLERVVGEDVAISFHPTNPIGSIKVDVSQMEQILMNLAVNARDAMPAGGKIAIHTENAELDEQYVREHPGSHLGWHVVLSVSDTGFGMDENIKSKIFEPFFTTKGLGKGTGLGLSTVYGIVKQNDGSIVVDSKPGEGATFKIHFPMVDTKAESLVQPPELVAAFAGTESILVVEDDDALRELAVSILQGSGYQVIKARDAETALGMLRDSKLEIDLLLTDVIMPGRSGPDLLTLAEAVRPGIHSLFMSGYVADLIGQRGVLPPEAAFLEKPFTSGSLLTKVYSALHGEPPKPANDI